MRYKAASTGFNWPATSQDSLFNEVASLELLLSAGLSDFGNASLTCLVGKAGGFLAHKPTGSLAMVVGQGTFGFLGWHAEVVAGLEPLTASLSCIPSAIEWHFLLDMDDWLSVPVEARLQNRFGPMVFEQVGEPMPLLVARIQEGLDLTVNQCKSILQHFHVSFDSKMKKEGFFRAIISMFLDSEEEVEQALEKSNVKGTDEKGEDEAQSDDSDMPDLLGELEDAGNFGDPDIKAAKKKHPEEEKQKEDGRCNRC